MYEYYHRGLVPALRQPWQQIMTSIHGLSDAPVHSCGLLRVRGETATLLSLACRGSNDASEWACGDYLRHGIVMLPRWVQLPIVALCRYESHRRPPELSWLGPVVKTRDGEMTVLSPELALWVLQNLSGLYATYLRVDAHMDVRPIADVYGRTLYAIAGARGLRAVTAALTTCVRWVERVAEARARAADQYQAEAVLS